MSRGARVKAAELCCSAVCGPLWPARILGPGRSILRQHRSVSEDSEFAERYPVPPSARLSQFQDEGVYAMKVKATLVLASMVLVGMSAAANAAKPDATPEQRSAKAEAMKKNRHAFKATQPRTMAQANATTQKRAGGAVAVRVPEELWNTLSVQRDANGNLRVVESDGTSAPATTTEGLPNE